MDKKKIKVLKERLIEEKKRLTDELHEIEDNNLKSSQSESSGENNYSDHFADSGTTTFERERDLSLERNIKDILDRVNSSLDRIKKGTFGVCTHCHQDIDPARLKALPYAELCYDCKKKEENL